MAKVAFKTYGCSNNFHESEVMAGLLGEDGHTMADEIDADVILLNICTVKGDQHAFKEIKIASELYPNKQIIVGGCVTKELREQIKSTFPKIKLFNTHNIQQVAELLKEELELKGKDENPKILLPKKRINPIINIVPINEGCTNHCSYCSVKLIKGNVKSYPVELIVEEVKKSINEGVKEIYLTSQDTAAYGADKNIQLPALLREVLKIDGEFFIRLGMGNPNHFIKYVDELIECFKDKKMYKFLHIPVQSGNNEILENMKREYSVEEYKEIIEKFKKAIPEITIATDVIVGYPEETDEQFNDTLKLIQETRPDVLNRSRYQLRENTPAAKMNQILERDKKTRSRIITSEFKKISEERNSKWQDWEGEIIINEIGKHDTFIGRNYCYKPVVVKGNFNLGDILKVKISETTIHDLRGEIN